MFRKTWTLLALAAVGSMVFANVDLRTNIRDIYYRGTCEEAGSITMSVNGNDFFEASTEEPVYIRVRLDKGGLLCDTLVDYFDGFTHFNVPIFLAMRVEGGINTLIAAPAETVSIVRWIGGEPELWLRVQASSNDWVSIGGATQPPNVSERVAWTFGQTARNSWSRNNVPFLGFQANLPCNSRNPGAAITDDAVSTLLCVDVSESILTPMPQLNSALMFDTISFDWQTIGVMDQRVFSSIQLGDQTSANFSGDDTIARGFDINCTMTYDKYGPVFADLCLDPAGQGGQDEGLVCMTNEIEINVYCEYGWNGQSYFYLAMPTGAAYGFPVITVGGDPWVIITFSDGSEGWQVAVSAIIRSPAPVTQMWVPFAFPEDVFVAGGNYLASLAFVMYWPYTSPDVPGPLVQIPITATVCMWHDNPPADVIITVGAWISNHGLPYDEAPFDGADQTQWCPWSFIHVGPIEWNFGSFLPCMSDRVSIFFPYLPKLIDTDYWTGISIVNHGLISFGEGEVMGNIYEADGSLWMVEFPALPVRNQYTWLVTDGDQGVGFYDDDAGIFLPVTAGGGDLVPMDLRSSMFVYAQAEGESLLDILGPDLDGFCLIGNIVTLVVYGYLPRNIYPELADIFGFGQTGDMPILTSKDKPVFDLPLEKTILGEVQPKTLR